MSAVIKNKFEIRNIELSLQENKILHGINVSIESGKIYTIVGPSGAGKSMFLRTLNRLVEIEKGDILLDGLSIKTMDPRELRRKVGMVFQLPVLFPGTVGENILAGPVLRGVQVPDDQQDGIIGKALESVDLPLDYADRRSDRISVGEQQRVCIARAIANDPEVLLMDEPTASLDPLSTQRIEKLIRSLNQDLDLTIVVITHNLEQAKRIGDMTMSMKEGRVIQTAITQDFFTETDHQTDHIMEGFDHAGN